MKKKCPKCGIEKELTTDNFQKSSANKNGFSYACKKCLNEKSNKHRNNMIKKKKITIIEKKCNKCKKVKKMKEFYNSIEHIDGHRPNCKECEKITRNKRLNTLNGAIKEGIRFAKRRSKKKKLKFNLTKEFIHELYHKQKGLCVISNIKMEYKSGHDQYFRNPYKLSIDRIDSTQGYIEGNIQLVCAKVNNMKNEMDQDEFLKLCKIIIINNEHVI